MKKNILFLILIMISWASYASDSIINANQRHHVINEYLNKLNLLDSDGVIALFEKDGKVISRHDGEVNAVDFYPVFVQKFLQLEMKERAFFKNPQNRDQFAVEIGSTGIKNTGEQVASTFVVIFEFKKDLNTFKKIIIFANDTIKNIN